MTELILTLVFLAVAVAAVFIKVLGFEGAVRALRSLGRKGDPAGEEPVAMTPGRMKKQLRQLESLHVAGMLTEKEYKARRQAILEHWRESK